MTRQELCSILQNTPLPDSEVTAVSFAEGGTVPVEDFGTTVTDLPAFYRVQTLSHPGPRSHIRSEIWLPVQWNGRLVGTGNGGIGGRLNTASMADFLRAGYACAHTDLGTSAGLLCGYQNTDVREDYGWRATHWMTLCAKALVRACYGRAPAYAYFSGCSTGGLQGYREAQRYPEDYDGIYAGVPSIINTVYHTGYLWDHVHLRTADGRRLFDTAAFDRLSALAAAYFQARGDGETGDGFVTCPYHGADTVDGFMLYLQKAAPELTAEQRAALRAVYTGPADPVTGRQIACGMPIGSERSMAGFDGPDCPGLYPFLWAFGPDFDPYRFDFSTDFAAFHREMGDYINAVDPDLSAFRAHGGKLLAFSGTADPVVPYPETDIYYERAAAAAGGAAACREFFRYFLLPGRAHGGGVGADRISAPGQNGMTAFDALVRWREEGAAPETLDAVSSADPSVPGKKPFTRTIYPYGSDAFPFREHPATYGLSLI